MCVSGVSRVLLGLYFLVSSIHLARNSWPPMARIFPSFLSLSSIFLSCRLCLCLQLVRKFLYSCLGCQRRQGLVFQAESISMRMALGQPLLLVPPPHFHYFLYPVMDQRQCISPHHVSLVVSSSASLSDDEYRISPFEISSVSAVFATDRIASERATPAMCMWATSPLLRTGRLCRMNYAYQQPEGSFMIMFRWLKRDVKMPGKES